MVKSLCFATFFESIFNFIKSIPGLRSVEGRISRATKFWTLINSLFIYKAHGVVQEILDTLAMLEKTTEDYVQTTIEATNSRRMPAMPK
jgi:hypothetical protein